MNTKELQRDEFVEAVIPLTDWEYAQAVAAQEAHRNKILEIYKQLTPENRQKLDDYVAELLKQREVVV